MEKEILNEDNNSNQESVYRKYLNLTGLPVLFASMCCLSPLILVMLGLASVSFAASLSDLFYGTYRWVFRGVGLLFLAIFLFFYFRRQGICSIDKVKRERTKIINTILVSLIVFVLAYIFFLYVVVHYVGVWYNIWE